MKAKIKSGHKLLFTLGASNDWSSIKDKMIINLADKGTYEGFHQTDNHLEIFTTNGNVDIVFPGNVPQLEFDHYEKDQLVFKIN